MGDTKVGGGCGQLEKKNNKFETNLATAFKC